MSTDANELGHAKRLADALVEYHQRDQSFDQERFLSRYADVAEDLLVHLDMDSMVLRMLTPTPAAGDGATLRSTSQPAVEFGDYELLEKISHGGMGVVYKARHKKLRRISAIKRPLPGLADDPVDRQRFLREARAAAGLRHPNICPIHVVGEIDGQPYIEMDFISGKTLSAWAREKRLSPRESAEIVARLARAVSYAHEHSVIHRDIKPRNVIVDEETGTPVLMDFGLARNLVDTDTRLTHSGEVLGTPAYMPPEQAAGKMDQVGPLSDIYSVGAVLYELLCGQPPFSCGFTEFLREVQIREPKPPRKLNPAMHRDLETICLKAMAKEPSRRYASALALAEELERFLAGEPIQARPPGHVGRAARWLRRRPMIAAAVGVMALSALAVFWQQGTILSLIISQQIQEREIQQVSSDAAAAEYGKLVTDVRNWLQAPVLGQKPLMLDHLVQASKIATPARNISDLRNLAAACLATVDLTNPRVLVADYGGRRLAFSPDGKRLAIGRYKSIIQCSARVIELETGRAKDYLFPSTWRTRNTGVSALSFSPDGRLLVAGTRDGYIHVWDTTKDTNSPAPSFKAHDSAINAISFRADGRMLVSGSKDKTVKQWDPLSWKQVDATTTSAEVGPITFSPVRGTMIRGGDSGLYWQDGAASLEQVGALCPSPAAPLLAASEWSKIRLFDMIRGREIDLPLGSQFPSAHNGDIHSLDMTPEGGLLVSASSFDGMVHVWNLVNGRRVCSVPAPGDGAVAAAFNPLGGTMAVLNDKQVVLYDVDGLVEQTTFAHEANPVKAIAFTLDGKALVTAALWNDPSPPRILSLSLWDVRTGRQLATTYHRFQGNPDVVKPPSIACQPNGSKLALGYLMEVHLLELTAPDPLSRFASAEAPEVQAVCFAPDGRSLWVAHQERVTRRIVPDLAATAIWQDFVSTVVSSQDNMVCVDVGRRWTLAGNRDGMVRLLEMRGTQIVLREQWPSGDNAKHGVMSVALTRDETLAASGNQTGTVRIVALPGAKVIFEQKAHADAVNSLMFSPDGLVLATGSKDGTVRLWARNSLSFEEALAITAGQPVLAVRFGADGNLLAVLVDNDLGVRLWHMDRLRRKLQSMGLDWDTAHPRE